MTKASIATVPWAILLFLHSHDGFVSAFLTRQFVTSPWSSSLPSSLRSINDAPIGSNPNQRPCSSLAASSSSSMLSSSPFASTSIKRRIVPSSVEVTILDKMANGTFGGVYFARNEANGQPLVAKSARAATPDERARVNADSYLEIEAYVNSKLCPPPHHHHDGNKGDDDMTQQQEDVGTRHVAPYVGECIVNGTTYLLWEASGEYTLEDYIEMEDGWVQLAVDLGLTENSSNDGKLSESNHDYDDEDGRQQLHNTLAAEVLRQILEGVAYCHSCGIVHRDIKPANILVDPKSQTLRLIDLGSACCMSSWNSNKLGFKGSNKGPRSILYCKYQKPWGYHTTFVPPESINISNLSTVLLEYVHTKGAPEEFVNEKHPYAFDLYGVAITWLRTVLSEDRYDDGEEDNDNNRSGEELVASFGLADEEDLFKWRLAVRDFGHNLVAWEEYATLHDSLPHGWDSLFGSSRQGVQGLRLLSNMMSYYPNDRMSASECLVGPYLNGDCAASPPPELPPAMPFSIMSHVQRWKKDREVHDGECQLDDLFTKVVAVELGLPLRIVLEAKEGDVGVRVMDIANDGTDATKLEVNKGDSLLSIASIDVENASIAHVMEILEQWDPDRPVPMLLVRDSD